MTEMTVLKMNSSSDRKAVAAAVICNALWGLSFLASRIALDTTPVFIILSHRFLLAFFAMSVLLLTPFAEIHLRGKSLWPLLLLGLMQPVIYFLGELYGILHSTTIFSGVMISVIPIAGVLAAVLFLKEIPSVTQIVFCVLAVSGVVGIGLLSHNSGSLEWSGVLGLVLAVCAAVAYTILNRSIAKTYTVFERTYIMMGVGAVIFTTTALASVKGDLTVYLHPFSAPGYLAAVLYLALFCSVVCFFLSCYTLSRLSVARATVFANLTTIVSVVAGAVILHEPLPPIGIACCGLILVGIYGVQHGAKQEA